METYLHSCMLYIDKCCVLKLQSEEVLRFSENMQLLVCIVIKLYI